MEIFVRINLDDNENTPLPSDVGQLIYSTVREHIPEQDSATVEVYSVTPVSKHELSRTAWTGARP